MPPEAIGEIAELLDLHPAEVHDTMTFYGFFRDEDQQARQDAAVGLPQPGVHAARRRGTARALCRRSSASSRGETTADGKITLEFAECLGACEGAPCVLVDDDARDERDDRRRRMQLIRRIAKLKLHDKHGRISNPYCWPASSKPDSRRLDGLSRRRRLRGVRAAC